MNQVIGRSEAERLGLKHYFTGKPCKYGHIEMRHIGDTRCVECRRISCRKSSKKWRDGHPEINRQRKLDCYHNKQEVYNEKKRVSRKRNREQTYEWARRWQLKHPEKICLYAEKRRIRKLNATLNWLTDDDYLMMEDFYLEANRLTRTTDINHEVDHIIPLKGKLVCGLHVPWNLQILTKSENAQKSNKFEDS